MSKTYGRCAVESTGEPEVMQRVQEPVRHAGPTEVRVRHEAIGVDYIETQIRAASALFRGLTAWYEKLRIKVGNSYPLRDAARAHADLVAGKTLGSVVLLS